MSDLEQFEEEKKEAIQRLRELPEYEPDLPIGVTEAVAILKSVGIEVHRVTVRRIIERLDIKKRNIGKSWVIAFHDLEIIVNDLNPKGGQRKD